MSVASESQAFDLLESALDQAFSAPPTLQPEVEAPTYAEVAAASPPAAAVQAEVPEESILEASGSDDAWKSEYEAQVQTWRAQSAEAREKAEKERLKWEAIRAIEKEEAAKRRAAGIIDEPVVYAAASQSTSEMWESVGEMSAATTAASSTPAEFIEVEPEVPVTAPSTTPAPATLPETPTEELHKWEKVPSMASSYPSMTFPERLDAPSHPEPAPRPAPVSVSKAVFDSSLSTRTRVVAVFSALAVNLLLPFVNGVMLGFGEIFAKNVVMGWFGWKSSASSVTNVGIRASSREERKKQQAL